MTEIMSGYRLPSKVYELITTDQATRLFRLSNEYNMRLITGRGQYIAEFAEIFWQKTYAISQKTSCDIGTQDKGGGILTKIRVATYVNDSFEMPQITHFTFRSKFQKKKNCTGILFNIPQRLDKILNSRYS